VLSVSVLLSALGTTGRPVLRDGLLAAWSFDEFDEEDLTTPDGSECGNTLKVDNVQVVKGVSGTGLGFGIEGGWGISTDMFPVDETVTVEAWFQLATPRPGGFPRSPTRMCISRSLDRAGP